MKVKLPMTSPHSAKDQQKANIATCFIGRGSFSSSTDSYRKAIGPLLANKCNYQDTDVVFISVEGNRNNRESFDKLEVLRAIKAGASFVCDNSFNRNRAYNIGERELYSFLVVNGYEEYYENKYYSLMRKKDLPMTNVRFDSVWDAIEDTPEQAEVMKLKSYLVSEIADYMNGLNESQVQLAKRIDASQKVISELLNGEIDVFNLDDLVKYHKLLTNRSLSFK